LFILIFAPVLGLLINGILVATAEDRASIAAGGSP